MHGVKMHMFQCVLTEEYDGVPRFSLSFLVQKLFAQKLDLPQKAAFFYLPWEDQNVT